MELVVTPTVGQFQKFSFSLAICRRCCRGIPNLAYQGPKGCQWSASCTTDLAIDRPVLGELLCFVMDAALSEGYQ